MLPAWIFRHRALAGATAASLCVGLATIGLSTFLPTYAQSVLGASAVRAGFVVAVMSIGWPIAATLANRLYLRIGFRNASLFGVVLMAAGAVLFITLTASSSLWHLAIASLMAGFGFGLITNPLMVGVQSVVGWQRRGVVTGASMFARSVGSALGAAVFGLVANAVLVRWFAGAPDGIRAQLPATLDDASKLLAGGGHAPAPVLEFVRTGMYEAVHSVLWLFAGITVLALATLLWTPSKFEELPD
jgi:MFS family permease